jgi:hypothetical protein
VVAEYPAKKHANAIFQISFRVSLIFVFDKFLSRPNVEVTVQQNHDGSESRNIKLPEGIEISQTRRNGETSTFALDNSGLGAVYCIWDVLVSIRAELSHCPENGSPKVRNAISTGIARINQFIAANSLTPITIKAIERGIDDKIRAAGARIAKRKTTQKTCISPFSSTFVQFTEKRSIDELRISIDKLLSVPRLPVLNPCF